MYGTACTTDFLHICSQLGRLLAISHHPAPLPGAVQHLQCVPDLHPRSHAKVVTLHRDLKKKGNVPLCVRILPGQSGTCTVNALEARWAAR